MVITQGQKMLQVGCPKEQSSAGWAPGVFRDQSTLVMLTIWKSLIRCKLEYCCLLWHPQSNWWHQSNWRCTAFLHKAHLRCVRFNLFVCMLLIYLFVNYFCCLFVCLSKRVCSTFSFVCRLVRKVLCVNMTDPSLAKSNNIFSKATYECIPNRIIIVIIQWHCNITSGHSSSHYLIVGSSWKTVLVRTT